MLLAANEFNTAIDALEVEAQRSSSRPARREPRVQLSTRIIILPCPQGVENGIGAPLSVPVRDLSRGGLRFLLPRRLPLDTQFIVVLPAGGTIDQPVCVDPAAIRASIAPMKVLCGVAYWQPIAKDLYAIGGQFQREVQGITMPDGEPRIVLPGEADGDADAPPIQVRRAS